MAHLKEWWSQVSPQRKRAILIVGLLTVLFVAASVFRREKAPTARVESKTDMSLVMPNRKDEGLAELRNQISSMIQEISKEKEENKRISAQVADLTQARKESENRQIIELQKEVAGLRDELKLQQSIAANRQTAKPAGDFGDLPPPIDKPSLPSEPPKPKIRVQGGEGASIPRVEGETAAQVGIGQERTQAPVKAAADGGKAPATNQVTQYIPAGTVMQGVLLNGVDAPTSGMGQKNPVPVLVRLKKNAILPNRFTQDLRECFVIMAGNGIMSSERVRLRAETISCVTQTGGVIETRLDGYAVDMDGKEGLRGQVVTKQGALLARGLMAGFLSGFGQMMTPTTTPTISISGNGTTQTQTPEISEAMRGGAMRGISQAAADYSKFYLDTAKEMYPVVELPGGVEVSIILVRGVQLAIGQSGSKSKWEGSWFGR